MWTTVVVVEVGRVLKWVPAVTQIRMLSADYLALERTEKPMVSIGRKVFLKVVLTVPHEAASARTSCTDRR
jgi:hypothetical protein